MISDVIRLNNEGAGIPEALAQAEAAAAYRSLDRKDALHIRLLAEEMLGMFRGMTGEPEADFWVEAEGRNFRLHLKSVIAMNTQVRKKLLSASTSGKNAAATGFMGKIRDLFERATEPEDETFATPYAAGWLLTAPEASPMTMGVWSFNHYQQVMKQDPKPSEEWDELEQSIVAKLADEVKVYIRKDAVELVIEKTV